MKVALIHERVGGRAGGGGGVRQMLELGAALHELGHEVVVAAHNYDPESVFEGPASELTVRGVVPHAPEFKHPRLDTIRLIAQGMRRVADLVPGDADVVNPHEWPALRAGAVAAQRLGVPLVWTRNDETFYEKALLRDEAQYPSSGVLRAGHAAFGLVDRRDARRADAIVVLDERNQRMVRRAYKRDAHIIRSGPSAGFFDAPSRSEARERMGVAPDTFLVVAFSIFFPHRRFEDVVEAAALLGDDVPRLEVRIVGSDHLDPGYADRVEQLVAERGVGDRVTVSRSGVSEAQLRELYAAASAYVFANQKQTWGLAPLEALAAGTPVVLSKGAGVHDVLAGRPGVEVVEPESPDQIAAALRRLAAGGDDGLAETRTWIRDEFTGRSYAEQMADLYADVVGARG